MINIEGSQAITWSTSKSGVASINNGGNITANAPGNATITATSKSGISGSVSVRVVDRGFVEPPPSGIKFLITFDLLRNEDMKGLTDEEKKQRILELINYVDIATNRFMEAFSGTGIAFFRALEDTTSSLNQICTKKPGEECDESCGEACFLVYLYNPKSYSADLLLANLESLDNIRYTLGFVDYEIFQKGSDVLGVAKLNGREILVSTYFNPNPINTILHEISHWFKEDHCNSRGCVMYGGNVTNSVTWCPTCEDYITDAIDDFIRRN
jgi:hypothetical protein